MNRKVTYICISIALALIVIGILLNQPRDVLKKAINICLECVGIG